MKGNNSPILDAIYETACDLHSCGAFTDEQVEKYQQLAPNPKPMILDDDVLAYLNNKCDFNAEKLQGLVNDWLRKDIEIARSVS